MRATPREAEGVVASILEQLQERGFYVERRDLWLGYSYLSSSEPFV